MPTVGIEKIGRYYVAVLCSGAFEWRSDTISVSDPGGNWRVVVATVTGLSLQDGWVTAKVAAAVCAWVFSHDWGEPLAALTLCGAIPDILERVGEHDNEDIIFESTVETFVDHVR